MLVTTVEATSEKLPALVTEITDGEPEDQTYRASEQMTLEDLLHDIPMEDVTVRIAGSEPVTSGVIWVLDIEQSDAYDPKGGTYRYIAQYSNTNLDDTSENSLVPVVTVTVYPSIPVLPTFNGTSVVLGTNTSATVEDLIDVLPTSGSQSWTDGDVTATLYYTIDWDDTQTLDITDLMDEEVFVGTLTYNDTGFPEWATMPSELSVSRSIGVTTLPMPETPPTLPPAPTPTPTPVPEQTAEGFMRIKIYQPDSEGNIEADFSLSEEDLMKLLEGNTSDEPMPVTIPITSETLLEMINRSGEGSINLNLTGQHFIQS